MSLHGWPERSLLLCLPGFGWEPTLQRQSLAGGRALSELTKVLTFQFKILIAWVFKVKGLMLEWYMEWRNGHLFHTVVGELSSSLHFGSTLISFRRMTVLLRLTNATTDVMARHTRRQSSFHRPINHSISPSFHKSAYLKVPRGRPFKLSSVACHARAYQYWKSEAKSTSKI